MEHSYIWLIAMVIFFIIEAIVPGLISIWCGMSALLTAIFAYFVKDITYQIYFFLIWSVILFLLTRNYLKEFMEKKKKENDGVERIIGKTVTIKRVNYNNTYNIYLDGKHWTGISEEKFQQGELAKVQKIQGIKLVLEKITEK